MLLWWLGGQCGCSETIGSWFKSLVIFSYELTSLSLTLSWGREFLSSLRLIVQLTYRDVPRQCLVNALGVAIEI